jgi:hypothetical protein
MTSADAAAWLTQLPRQLLLLLLPHAPHNELALLNTACSIHDACSSIKRCCQACCFTAW